MRRLGGGPEDPPETGRGVCVAPTREVRRPPGWRCARREIAQVSVGRFYASAGTTPRPPLFRRLDHLPALLVGAEVEPLDVLRQRQELGQVPKRSQEPGGGQEKPLKEPRAPAQNGGDLADHTARAGARGGTMRSVVITMGELDDGRSI